jgi:hypothetical protein
MVRFGSKTVMTAPKRYFRSTPNNGHHQTGPLGPVRARKRHSEWVDVNSKVRFRSRNKGFVATRLTETASLQLNVVTTKADRPLALLIVNAAVVTYWDCWSKVALYESVPSDHKERVLARKEKEGR